MAVCFSLGATDAGSRFNDLGHRLMCTCGCAEILGECNHVGCPESGRELRRTARGHRRGQSDQQILTAFVAKYGAVVLAAPTTQGFDLVAWIAPFAVFARGAAGHHPAGAPLVGGQDANAGRQADVGQSRIRTSASDGKRIRRETGSDGGF